MKNKRVSRPAVEEKVSQADYERLAVFRHALREFHRFSEEAAMASGLPPRQHQALLAIKGHERLGPVNVGWVAGRLRLRHQSAVGLINRMAGRGLVRKRTGQEDRREVFLRLTGRGENLLRQLSAVHKAEIARLGPALMELMKEIGGGA